MPYRAPAGPPSIHRLYMFFPLYRMKGGRRSPDADPQQWTVMYWWPESPPTSWTALVPLLASTLVVVGDVQKAVSSQFQRRYLMLSGSNGSKARLANMVSSFWNHAVIISLLLAFALFLLRFCGFFSLRLGHRFINLCHQSHPGMLPVKGLGIPFSLMYSKTIVSTSSLVSPYPMSASVMQVITISRFTSLGRTVGPPAPTVLERPLTWSWSVLLGIWNFSAVPHTLAPFWTSKIAVSKSWELYLQAIVLV